MNDRWKIIAGLAVFLVLFTTPIWLNLATGRTPVGPDLELLTRETPGKERCVMSAKDMTAEHMDLLNRWREEVVRTNHRTYQTADGRSFTKSLTNTCFDCHSNKDKFCDRCHSYMGVEPYCWSCHLEPKDFK